MYVYVLVCVSYIHILTDLIACTGVGLKSGSTLGIMILISQFPRLGRPIAPRKDSDRTSRSAFVRSGTMPSCPGAACCAYTWYWYLALSMGALSLQGSLLVKQGGNRIPWNSKEIISYSAFPYSRTTLVLPGYPWDLNVFDQNYWFGDMGGSRVPSGA